MRISTARTDDFEINVISLIDVMLTLLMFFVMTTTFVQHSALKVALPEASETVSDAPQNPLVILVDSTSHYYVDNKEVLNPSLDSLKQAITHVAGDNRESQVILRADAMTPHQTVITALDALGQLGYTHISIATTPSRGNEGR